VSATTSTSQYRPYPAIPGPEPKMSREAWQQTKEEYGLLQIRYTLQQPPACAAATMFQGGVTDYLKLLHNYLLYESLELPVPPPNTRQQHQRAKRREAKHQEPRVTGERPALMQ